MCVLKTVLQAKFHETLGALISVSGGQFSIALVYLALFGL